MTTPQLIFIILWLITGFISYQLIQNAWKENFYRKVGIHYIHTPFYNKYNEMIFAFCFSFMGLIATFILFILGGNMVFKSEWQLFYSKSKMEKKYSNKT